MTCKQQQATACVVWQDCSCCPATRSASAFELTGDITSLLRPVCRYAVSELLPESGSAEGAPAAAAKGGPAAKGKAASKPSAPLVPQGKAKAAALIAAGKDDTPQACWGMCGCGLSCSSGPGS